MEKKTIKALFVNGSPRKRNNTSKLLESAMQGNVLKPCVQTLENSKSAIGKEREITTQEHCYTSKR